MTFQHDVEDFKTQLRRLSLNVESSQAVWNDSIGQEFVHNHWQPLEETLTEYSTALDDLSRAILDTQKQINSVC